MLLVATGMLLDSSSRQSNALLPAVDLGPPISRITEGSVEGISDRGSEVLPETRRKDLAAAIKQENESATPDAGAPIDRPGDSSLSDSLRCELEQSSRADSRLVTRDCRGASTRERGAAGARAYLSALAPEFGLRADLSDLELVEEKHGLGSSRTLFRQTLAGLPVHDSNITVNQGADGSLQAVYSSYRALSPESAIPDLSAAAAESVARAGAEVSSIRMPTDSELVWYARFKGVATLAWRLVVYSQKPLGDFLTLVDAQTGKLLLQENRIAFDTGSGYAFVPNPMQASGDLTLVDASDGNSAALSGERVNVTLLGLDPGIGTLKGEFVDLVSLAGGKGVPDADESTRVYDYERSNDRFEQVVIYHSVDSIQRYFHSLGFDDDTGIPNGIRDFPTLAHAHWDNADQSFYSTGDDAIHFGDGGVDDGEDADIIAHEFGHAVQHDQNACWGGGEMGAMGEGFGDYLAASFYAGDGDATFQASHAACVGEWDATSYSGSSPPCLRRVDENKSYPGDWVGQVHADGEIWSRALWDIRSQLGQTTADQLVLEHHFNVPCGASMPDAAQEMLQADVNLNSGTNEAALRQAFCDRGILSGAECIPPSNLSLQYGISPDPPISGEVATLTLIANNSSTSTLVGIALEAALPAGSSFVPGSASDGGAEVAGSIQWPVSDVPASGQISRSFEIQLDASPGSLSLFEDDMEAGAGAWLAAHVGGSVDWSWDSSQPHAGTHAQFASEPAEVADQYLELANAVSIVAGASLRFWHHYDIETGYDGGVIEISTDGGTTWNDLGGQITQNSYSGLISDSFSNPIAGRSAYTGSSSGYIETTVDLAPQAGQDAKIRFRMATDSSVSGNGWFVDDVAIGTLVTLESTAAASGGGVANASLSSQVAGPLPNSPPVLNVNAGLVVDEAAPATIDNSRLQLTDPDASDILTLTVTIAPAHGSLSLGSSFTQAEIDASLLDYTHDGSENLSDSFSFTAADGNGGTLAETLFSITVTPVNDAPVAVEDAIVVAEGATATTLADGVTLTLLGNDTDAEGDPLTASLVATAANGSLSLASDGTFSYAHDGSETTSDSFSYQVNDGGADSNTATVTIAITPVNDAPIADDDSITVDEDGTATTLADGVTLTLLGNDTDAEGDPLTASLVATAANGSLSLASDGTFSYVHDGSETTSDSFSYQVNDGGADSNTATVTIAITPVNDAPVLLVNLGLTLLEGGNAPIDASLLQVTDGDGVDTLTYSVTSAPSFGNLSLGNSFTQAEIDAASLIYTHNGSETSADAFAFSVSDGNGGVLGPLSFMIAIDPSNDAPELGLTSLPDATVGAQYEVNFTPLDPDPGDTLTVIQLSGPSWLLSPLDNGDGSWTLFGTPQAGDEGIQTVLLQVNDSATPSGEQQLSLPLLVQPMPPLVPMLDPWALGVLVLTLLAAGWALISRAPEFFEAVNSR